MTRTKTNILIFFLLFLLSCGDKDNAILNKKNFDKGNWLLVVQDYADNTMFVIDDEKILKENPFGLLLGPMAGCGGTTCDGFIELYKDGGLVAQQEYLSRGNLIETKNIINAYKKASEKSISPDNQDDFSRQWDSLLKLDNIYPTRRHVQPEDKDIIVYFKIE
jgi:hypothetical protein